MWLEVIPSSNGKDYILKSFLSDSALGPYDGNSGAS